MLNPNMSDQELKLHMGEMSEQEIRTARAAIAWANSNTNMLGSVISMYKQFGIDRTSITTCTREERYFRGLCLSEEVEEFITAENAEDQLDALVDLTIFALGTAERMGFSSVFYEAFARVMQANNNKQVGSNSKRGDFRIDLVKPEGWQAPDLTDLVSQ